MPIAVRVVTQDKFDAWVEEAKAEYADKGHLDETLLASGVPFRPSDDDDTRLAAASE
jgi:heme/copper-type cytochrome/quinol oxidase subunit 2